MNRDWAIYNINNFQLVANSSTAQYSLSKPFDWSEDDFIISFTPLLNGTVYFTTGLPYNSQYELYEDNVLVEQIPFSGMQIEVKAYKKYKIKVVLSSQYQSTCSISYDVMMKPKCTMVEG